MSGYKACFTQIQVGLPFTGINRPLLIFQIENMDSLYVYEAKMSLFIKMAQSKAGAERLLEARVLSALADCDFLDSRPEIGHGFTGLLSSYMSVLFELIIFSRARFLPASCHSTIPPTFDTRSPTSCSYSFHLWSKARCC